MQRQFNYDPEMKDLMFEVLLANTKVDGYPDLTPKSKVLLINRDIVKRADPQKTTSILVEQVPKSMHKDSERKNAGCFKRDPFEVPGNTIPYLYKHLNGDPSKVCSIDVLDNGAMVAYTFGRFVKNKVIPFEERTFGGFTVRLWRTFVYRYDQCENYYAQAIEITSSEESEYFFFPISEIPLAKQPERRKDNPDFSHEIQFLNILEAAHVAGNVWGLKKALMFQLLGGAAASDFKNQETIKFHRYTAFTELYPRVERILNNDSPPTLLTALIASLLHGVRIQHEGISLKDALIGYRADNVAKAWETIVTHFFKLNPNIAASMPTKEDKANLPEAINGRRSTVQPISLD